MDWIDHDAKPNGIGPICRYCRNLIDSPLDHAVDCPARPLSAILALGRPKSEFNQIVLGAHIREAEAAVAQCETDVGKYGLDVPNVVHKLASAQSELRAAWELLEGA